MAVETGLVTRYFMIDWNGAGVFWWYRDQVLFNDAAEDPVVKLVHLARASNAKVFCDEGESYDLARDLPGQEKLIVTLPGDWT